MQRPQYASEFYSHKKHRTLNEIDDCWRTASHADLHNFALTSVTSWMRSVPLWFVFKETVHWLSRLGVPTLLMVKFQPKIADRPGCGDAKPLGPRVCFPGPKFIPSRWVKQCHKRTIPQENHHVYRWYGMFTIPRKMGGLWLFKPLYMKYANDLAPNLVRSNNTPKSSAGYFSCLGEDII